MIELKNDALIFTFPQIHATARLKIYFQRTLRIPDNDKDYPLPPGLDLFPLRHVDDYADAVPGRWLEQGGVMFPMYPSESFWIRFRSERIKRRDTAYPFAVKVATGKINALTGDPWSDGLRQNPQDYLVTTENPWLDGYCAGNGMVRQFVAMPLGSGYSAEEQITGKAEFGGIQISVYPMKPEIFENRFPLRDGKQSDEPPSNIISEPSANQYDMGISPGGRISQESYESPFKNSDWDTNQYSRCFVHILNSMVWRTITLEPEPALPFTATEYNSDSLPWYDYYNDDATVLSGSEKLNGLKSVHERRMEKYDNPLPDNESVRPQVIFTLRKNMRNEDERQSGL